MELWNRNSKVCDIEGVYQSNRKEMIVTFGQLAPLETIRFLEIYLVDHVAAGMGDEFSIREDDMIFPISIHRIHPS